MGFVNIFSQDLANVVALLLVDLAWEVLSDCWPIPYVNMEELQTLRSQDLYFLKGN